MCRDPSWREGTGSGGKMTSTMSSNAISHGGDDSISYNPQNHLWPDFTEGVLATPNIPKSQCVWWGEKPSHSVHRAWMEDTFRGRMAHSLEISTRWSLHSASPGTWNLGTLSINIPHHGLLLSSFNKSITEHQTHFPVKQWNWPEHQVGRENLVWLTYPPGH